MLNISLQAFQRDCAELKLALVREKGYADTFKRLLESEIQKNTNLNFLVSNAYMQAKRDLEHLFVRLPGAQTTRDQYDKEPP